MEQYKLGNRVRVIIRAWSAGKIGDYTLTYQNEPFLILDDIEMRMGYRNKVSESSSAQDTLLSYNIDSVSEVEISDIPISDKILSLIYSKNEIKLCNVVENCTSDEDKKIYLTSPRSKIYQVFIFKEGQMIQAYGVEEFLTRINKLPFTALNEFKKLVETYQDSYLSRRWKQGRSDGSPRENISVYLRCEDDT